MNIRIVNLRNYTPVPGEVLIKVDRSSILGNPFVMVKERQRDEACDLYKVYFNRRIQHLFDPLEDIRFNYALDTIFHISLISDVALGCWCAPKRCHAETIIDYVLKGGGINGPT